MGMSASQARLLSITARLTNNEFRAQTITNSKLRLASESEVASAKYMDALNSKQLMFMSYDDNGDANKVALTANTLLMYGDLKNQYALVNNSGKILLNNLDIKNYESSETMADFMYKYGIGKVENPEYEDSLIEIFGSNYADIFELKDDPYSWVMSDSDNFLPYVYNLEEFENFDILKLTESDYNTLRNTYFSNLDNAGINGTLEDKLYGNTLFTNMITNLLNCPEYVNKPDFSWINNAKKLINEFIEALNNLPTKLVPDEKDSKYQWYKNLWYRMGSTDEKTKGNGGYLVIDDNLLNNDEWLQFAFEHGILTLERAEFVEQGSDVYTKMGTYDWVATPYKNAGDFVEVDDEKAIAIAEVKYKKTITEIESKDNKYDQDLKKLDTEHTALQTEYDSIKEVISKNVDRSFKAFS